MSEELIQRNLIDAPEKMGDWNFYNIGSTTLKALKNAKIIPNRDYNEFEDKKPDAIITKRPVIIAAIEYKKPSELRTAKQIKKAIEQEFGVAQILRAKVYIVTDGKKSYWINPATGNEILQEDGSKITLNFEKKSTDCITLINKIRASINATNDTIRETAPVDPLPLAQKVWQDLWAVSGATPENCLYTFVEIFIFKYLSDLGVLSGMHSFYDLLGRYSGNNEDEVLKLYASTIRPQIKELFPGSERDHTTIINGTIFVSKDDKAVSGYSAVFHKILKRFNEFGTLENIDFDFKSKLFETFLKESISKKNWGQYFTPLKVVRAIVNMVDITAGMEVCDPACGVGKFLLELILPDLHRYYQIEDETLIPRVTLAGFDKGFDKEEQKTIILAKANMLIYMSEMIKEYPDITKQFAKIFNDTFLLQTNSILGTLAKPIYNKYDLILTNPPYVMSGSSNLKEEIAKDETLKNYYTVSAMGIEGLFMEWIVHALKPDGKAFVVVPDGIMNRGNDKKLRDFILEQCYVDAVISLPLNTFFTTNKKTYILALTKKTKVNINGVPMFPKQTTPVFTYLCSEIGETRDVYRFDIDQNDLETASDLFNMFKGAKEKFENTINDKRCKIINIDDFYNGTHWSIDRWWTEEEKIELGVEEEPDAVDIGQFITLLQDVSSSIIEYQEPLQELEKKKYKPFSWVTVNMVKNELWSFITSSIGKNRTLLASMDTQNDEDIPVYTAGKGPIAYVKPIEGKGPIYAADDSPILSFATNGDGSAARNFVIHDRPFYINTDRIALKINVPDILPEYLQLQLLYVKQKYNFNHSHKANLKNLTAVEVVLPCNDCGFFDVEYQRYAVSVMRTFFMTTVYVKERIGFISSLTIKIDMDVQTRYIQTSLANKSLFNLSIGKRLLRKDYVADRGSIPAYSANVHSPFAFVDASNITDFDYDYLIWGIDGTFEFRVIKRGTLFATTDHCGAIQIMDQELSPYYLLYVIDTVKKTYGFDRGLRASLNNMRQIEVKIPIKSDGMFDYDLMNDIGSKYSSVLSCKSDILSQLSRVLDLKLII